MSVTVVVPSALQRQGTQLCLESVILSAQQVPDAEVIVVANGPGVRQPKFRIDSPIVTVVACEQASAASARNVGIDSAHYCKVLFTDDDCMVPRSWCADLSRALSFPDTAAVAAPVRVGVLGPVTSFLNYQRIFDAPPVDGEHARCFLTGNCGIHKDHLQGRVRFDDSNFVVGGEDTEFGYAIRDLGFCIRWLNHVQPVYHIVSESIDEVTERFVGYGRASAKLFYKHGRWLDSVPDAIDWFRTISQNRYGGHRRFGELTDPLVQRAFASFELMLTSAFLIGYLDELGAELGYRLVAPDYGALRTTWHELVDEIVAGSHSDNSEMWSRLPVHADRWSSQLESGLFGRPSSKIARNLCDNAPAPASVPHEVDAVLNSGREQFSAMQERQRVDLGTLIATRWDEITAQTEALEYHLRNLGISYTDGCHEIEEMIFSKLTKA